MDILEAMGVEYLIWGGVAAALYGEPRFTQDMDLVLAWVFEHARRQPFDEVRSAVFMPPEAVILTKLRAYEASGSDRHRRDIEGILRVSGPHLDMDYIGLEAARLGLMRLWRELSEALAGE